MWLWIEERHVVEEKEKKNLRRRLAEKEETCVHALVWYNWEEKHMGPLICLLFSFIEWNPRMLEVAIKRGMHREYNCVRVEREQLPVARVTRLVNEDSQEDSVSKKIVNLRGLECITQV